MTQKLRNDQIPPVSHEDPSHSRVQPSNPQNCQFYGGSGNIVDTSLDEWMTLAKNARRVVSLLGAIF